MYNEYSIWRRIANAAAHGEWLGFDSEFNRYIFYAFEAGSFEPLAPATVLCDLIGEHEDHEDLKGVHIVVAAPGDRPHLYPHPGIDILVIPEERVVFGPLDESGQRTSVYVE